MKISLVPQTFKTGLVGECQHFGMATLSRNKNVEVEVKEMWVGKRRPVKKLSL